MRIDLTLPGRSSKRKASRGKIVNKTKKDPQKDAEDLWEKTVSANTADTSLYRQHTRSGTQRTQQAYGDYKGGDIVDPDRTVSTTQAPSRPTNTNFDRSSGMFSFGKITRALKALTGL